MSKHIRFYLFACVFALLASLSVWAQSTVTGAVGGVVTDPRNAVVPGASVTVRNTGTNKEAQATSDNEGHFRVTNLEPGIYAVTVNSSGFGEYKQENVVVEVGRVTTLNIDLQVTAVSGTVEISTDAPVINTEQQDFSSNINQTSINELPINGRRWSNYALLTPGSTPDGAFGLVSFRGISGLLNNSTVDGGDNNQAFFSEERGRTRISYSTSQSAIREFQVNTSNYSAEYGRAAGGVVNAVTKSGTNEFHGDLFYYNRNNRFGARNPRAFQSVLVNGVAQINGIKPKDVRQQFGGTLGGPIVRDRLFFFFSYDEQRRDFPGLGIFDQPNYLTTVNRTLLMTPVGAGTTAGGAGLTTAQIDAGLNFINSLSGTVPRRGDQRIFFPKIDWRVNNNNTFTIGYNRLRWDSPAGIQTQATNARGIASFGDDFVDVDTVNARLNSTFGTIVNEARFQYSRDLERQISQPPAPGEPTTGINGSAPDVFLTNGLEFGKPTFLERAKYPDEKKIQFADTITMSLGSHTLKFGGDAYRTKDILSNLRNESGAYSYNNINDFIVDYTNFRAPLSANARCATTAATRFAGRCYTGNFAQGFGLLTSEVRTVDYGFFIQDDMRLSPRLTVNLGLRYEYEKSPKAFIPSTSTVVVPNINQPLNVLTANLPSDKNNFGPRIGFAYGITGDGKTSVRGGYGIYFGRIINSTISNALVNTGAAGGQFQVSLASTASGAPIFPNVLPSLPAGTIGAIQYFAPNFAAPEIHQGDLIFERQIARNTAVSASFLFSVGRKLPTFVDRNLSVPTATLTYNVVGGPLDGQTILVPAFATARPLAASGFTNAITEIQSSVKSDYTALVLQLNRRLTDGLQFQINYTRSRASDTNQTSTTFTANNIPQNVFDLTTENGRSNFDIPNKFVASVIYGPVFKTDSRFASALINHWTVSPIFSYYSGRPYDGTVSGSAGGAGSFNRSGGATRFPTLSRNNFRQPSISNVDLRLSRRFVLKENVRLEFLAEAFNLLNRTQVTNINNTFYTRLGAAATNTQTQCRTTGVDCFIFNPAFGQITEAGGTLFRERQIQFAARFEF